MEKYKIANGKAYTGDNYNVLVYNIIVYNLPKETTTLQILNYFQQFGPIVKVHFMQRMAVLKFLEETAAARVLSRRLHFLNEKRVHVCVSDSFPPYALPATSTEREEEQKALILNVLNDDCLQAIYEKLRNADQINFAGTCRRLRDVFINYSRIAHRKVDFSYYHTATICQKLQFLELAGQSIQNLEVQWLNDSIVNIIADLISTFCTNVSTLNVNNTRLLYSPLVHILTRNMSLITTLKLTDNDLDDNCIQYIKRLPTLKVLHLDGNCKITGAYIKDLTNIECLSLNGCKSLTIRNLTKICENLKFLNTLGIWNCGCLENKDIISFVKHLKQLETLQIFSDYDNIESIAQLPKLKHLSLVTNYWNPLPAYIFEDIATQQGNQLETLYVNTCIDLNPESVTYISKIKKLKKLACPGSKNITDDSLGKLANLYDLELLNLMECKEFTSKGLLDLIKCCPKLHTLNVGRCKQLNKAFAMDVLDVLRKREPRKCLNVLAFSSGIHPDDVKTPEFELASELVQFHFGYESDVDCDMYYYPENNVEFFLLD